jgi:hypothetical protein
LRRLIRTLDRFLVSNCYRQVLLETAVDAGAAAESLMLGFRRTSRPGSGHAWFESEVHRADYDIVVSV